MNYYNDNMLYKGGKRYRLDKTQTETINMTIINKLIEQHLLSDVKRHKKLQKYYLGQHDILNRTMTDTAKPNNKLANPFCTYITNQLTSYFMGTPVRYQTDEEDKGYLEQVQLIMDLNDESTHNSELAKTMSIHGTAFELVYLDENGIPKFTSIPVNEVFVVYDTALNPTPAMAIRYYNVMNYITEKEERVIEVYTKDLINTYKGEGDKITQVSSVQHYFGAVPVVQYFNGAEAQGDFENITSLVDNYDIAQSNLANDFDYMSDSYLILKGMMETQPEDISEMRQNRVLLLDGEGADASWLTREVQVENIESFKKRLEKDIMRFTGALNISDEAFPSNLSGTAIKYKTLLLENVASNKERMFKKSLMQRLKLITTILNIKGHNFTHVNIVPVFKRSLPQNLIEAGQFASQMFGVISQKTLLSQMPFVEDIEHEIQMIADEKKNSVPTDDYEFPLNEEENVEGA